MASEKWPRRVPLPLPPTTSQRVVMPEPLTMVKLELWTASMETTRLLPALVVRLPEMELVEPSEALLTPTPPTLK